jgi:hypothetical protein
MPETPIPDRSGRLIVRHALRSRFGLLFLTLLLAILLPTIMTPDMPGIELLVTVTVTVVVLSGLYAVADNKRHVIFGLILLVPAITLEWLYHGVQARALDMLSAAFSILFFFYLAWLTLLFVLSARRVDANIVFAAICVYLLLGYTCGYAYYLIEALVGDLDVIATVTGNVGYSSPRSEAVYFSFVTLTTLGYGDISPLAPLTRSLAIVEAVSGQLFLVTLIARLVALHITHSSQNEDAPRPPAAS